MQVSVLVVTYNSSEFIETCLDSLFRQKEIEFEIVVVDNASQDTTIAILEKYQNKLCLIRCNQNMGFGKANNLASHVARGKWLFLLNPDTELPEEDTLKKLCLFAEQHPCEGLIGTKILSFDRQKEVKPFYYYPGEKYLQSPFPSLPGKIAWVLGASLWLSRKLYGQVKGFDENFFLYGEDVDLCIRIRQQGYEIGYCSEVLILHWGGGSEKNVNIYERVLKKQKGLYGFYKKYYTRSDIQFLLRRELRRATYRLCLYFCVRWMTLRQCGEGKYLKQKALRDSCRYELEHAQ